ncbi:hypothetical protein [Mesorhizobium sp. SP-1A]|uniref:hypothetical protein n=1 Tax=Mesorhizobium sp. SP-1A TaxID=3077840 RepID=UPI0028F6C3AF|nr:hypothetical protein [Mesorhizobium sp. SP-1A]
MNSMSNNSHICDWFRSWEEAALAADFRWGHLTPISIRIGGLKNPEKVTQLNPICWMNREAVEAGSLQINKELFQTGRIPSVESATVGRQHLLSLIQQSYLCSRSNDPASFTFELFNILVQASLHEFDCRKRFGVWRQWSRAARQEIKEQLGETHTWHDLSRKLGPDDHDALLWIDHMEDAANTENIQRPLTSIEVRTGILLGLKSVFDQYALVAPIYSNKIPDEFADDFFLWYEGGENI